MFPSAKDLFVRFIRTSGTRTQHSRCEIEARFPLECYSDEYAVAQRGPVNARSAIHRRKASSLARWHRQEVLTKSLATRSKRSAHSCSGFDGASVNDIELDIPTGEEANGILLQRFDKIEQLCTNVV